MALGLSGCMTTPPSETAATATPDEPAVFEPSDESLGFQRYYRGVEQRLVQSGMLRTDGGETDAPFNASQLAVNFENIALFNEYTLSGGRFVARRSPAFLRRWEDPVNLQAHFGRSVSDAQKAQDRAVLTTYAQRLSRVTRHPVRTVNSGGNFHVFYVDRDDQLNLGDQVRGLVPGISDQTIREMENLSRSTFCSVYAFSETGERPVYIAAIAIIRDEHPPLLRRSCVHEEIAQGMGLPNDSPAARPTIFNDDEEFALLTPHDELLLRMLYDDRLSVGLTPDQARPTVQRIAEEIMGGPS